MFMFMVFFCVNCDENEFIGIGGCDPKNPDSSRLSDIITLKWKSEFSQSDIPHTRNKVALLWFRGQLR